MENIKFTSKIDHTFKVIFLAIFIFLVVIFSIVFAIEGDSLSMKDFIVAIGICSFLMGLLLWLAFDITYEFKKEYLYLRAGFLFTRIRYEEIESYRHLDGFMDVTSGFNLLSSTKGIAIMSQKVLLGEVKISPTDIDRFIQELEKRMKSN